MGLGPCRGMHDDATCVVVMVVVVNKGGGGLDVTRVNAASIIQCQEWRELGHDMT